MAWSCSSGEMRNHVAVHGHTDVNTSHPFETLTLFVRLPSSAKPNIETVKTYFKDGYLYLPIHGIVVRYNIGKQIIHCNFKNTFHIPDKSRNDKNW